MCIEIDLRKRLDSLEPSTHPILRGYDAMGMLGVFDQVAETVRLNAGFQPYADPVMSFPTLSRLVAMYGRSSINREDALRGIYAMKKRAFHFLREQGYDMRLARSYLEKVKIRSLENEARKNKELIAEGEALLKA